MRRFLPLFLWLPVLAAQVIPGRYIVELEGEPAAMYAAKTGRRAAVADRRAAVQASQAAARRALEAAGAQVLGAVDTVANALIVRVRDDNPARLAGLPGVARVEPDVEVRLTLDTALPLHKVPDAWNLIGGGDRAGLGVKIGIVDSGIDHEHPAFQDVSLAVPDGFPKVNQESDRAFTNNKIIVARSYSRLSGEGLESSAADEHGHGTAVAMAAAGAVVDSPLGVISGVAPKAQLGNYKVFFGGNGTTQSSFVLKALDDAVADGMDVVNLSLGSPLAPRPAESVFASAVERAAAAGVLVIASAGNEGPDPNTINVWATAGSAIAVGASVNGREFAMPLTVEGAPPYAAIPGNGPNSSDPITAPLFDVAQLDGNGRTCSPLAPDSLAGRIAFILRGDCFFEVKLANAQQAGAVAAVVYTDAEREVAIMSVGSARLPASMISYADGLDVKRRLGENPGLVATLSFTRQALPSNPNRVAGFSSRGPNPDDGVKPDLVAVGVGLYTAMQRVNPQGELFDASGFGLLNGTSFSSPLVAGAAAVLKGARPGLTVRQYRSLLINSATAVLPDGQRPAPAQTAGTGLLDLNATLRATVAAYPTALSFGTGAPTPEISRNLTISNLGTAADTFSIAVQAGAGVPAPQVSATTLAIEPGGSRLLEVRFPVTDLAPGEYQGVLVVRGTQSEVGARVPFWHAMPSGTPRYLTILNADESGTAGTLIRNAIYFRVTDAAGLALRDAGPAATAVEGGGEVVEVRSLDRQYPGVFGVDIRLGPQGGRNIFRIQAGDLSKEVVLEGRSSPAAP